jgi:GTP-binding protein
MKPLVAIVGRPNVGKSTLFNRLVGEFLAIVEDQPGTTRDRLYADAEWSGHTFTLIDTGGLEPKSIDDYAARVRAQAELAIAEADVIIFLVDAREGATGMDKDIAEILRRTSKPVLLAANKADNLRRRQDTVEFYELGLGDPLPVSSLHGTGTGDLLDEVVAHFPPPETETEEVALRIAIVGRPNVGKSSLLNALVGEDRVIVSEQPGTTRDAIDTVLEHNGQRIVLIDTAGIRKRGRVIPGIEKYSVMRALRAIDRADVVALLVDAEEGVTAQDTHIAGYVAEAMKGLVIAVNKWDLVRAAKGGVQDPKAPDYRLEYEAVVRDQFNFVDYAPILFISAKTGQRLTQVLDAAVKVKEQRQRRIPTAQLNAAIQESVSRHEPPSDHGRHLKVLYVTQVSIEPPTFVFFVNDPKLLHFTYRRFIENEIRQRFGFQGTAIQLIFKHREDQDRG